MRKRNELKRIVKEIKKYLEVYLLTQDHKALLSAEKDYYKYLSEGGKKSLDSIKRMVKREYCLSRVW